MEASKKYIAKHSKHFFSVVLFSRATEFEKWCADLLKNRAPLYMYTLEMTRALYVLIHINKYTVSMVSYYYFTWDLAQSSGPQDRNGFLGSHNEIISKTFLFFVDNAWRIWHMRIPFNLNRCNLHKVIRHIRLFDCWLYTFIE